MYIRYKLTEYKPDDHDSNCNRITDQYQNTCYIDQPQSLNTEIKFTTREDVTLKQTEHNQKKDNGGTESIKPVKTNKHSYTASNKGQPSA